MMEKTEFVTKDNVHEATNLEKIRVSSGKQAYASD